MQFELPISTSVSVFSGRWLMVWNPKLQEHKCKKTEILSIMNFNHQDELLVIIEIQCKNEADIKQNRQSQKG